MLAQQRPANVTLQLRFMTLGARNLPFVNTSVPAGAIVK